MHWRSKRGEVYIILQLVLLFANPVVHQTTTIKFRENLCCHQNLDVIENTIHFLRTLQEPALLLHFCSHDSWHSNDSDWNSWTCLLLHHRWRQSLQWWWTLEGSKLNIPQGGRTVLGLACLCDVSIWLVDFWWHGFLDARKEWELI